MRRLIEKPLSPRIHRRATGKASGRASVNLWKTTPNTIAKVSSVNTKYYTVVETVFQWLVGRLNGGFLWFDGKIISKWGLYGKLYFRLTFYFFFLFWWQIVCCHLMHIFMLLLLLLYVYACTYKLCINFCLYKSLWYITFKCMTLKYNIIMYS